MSLITDLKAYWKCNEASGNLLDSHNIGPYNLTASSSIATAIGILDNARSFDSSISGGQYFFRADNPDLSSGDVDFFFAAWVKLTIAGTASYRVVAGKAQSGANEWYLWQDGSAGGSYGRFKFSVHSTGSGSKTDVAHSSNIELNTWYHIQCWHNSIDNTINISVNGVETSVGYSAGVYDGFTDFTIGTLISLVGDPLGRWDGLIDECYWRKGSIPTLAERVSLYNGGMSLTYPFTHDLLSSLVSYWKMDELSGNALDTHGSNTLIQSGTVGSVSGRINTSRQFTNASANYLWHPYNITLDHQGHSFTYSVWIYLNSHGSAGATPYIFARANASDYGLDLYYDEVDHKVTFILYGTPAGDNAVSVDSGITLSLSTWYHIVIWYDEIAQIIGISINNGTPVTAPFTTPVSPSSVEFYVGQYFDGAGSSYCFTGRIDEVGFWKCVLTASERNNLYNVGRGLAYPFTVTLTTALVSYWKLDELSGNALDAHGTNTLTQVGTIGTTVGKVSTCRDFPGGGSHYFTLADNADLGSSGNESFTLSCWFNLDIVTGYPRIVHKSYNGSSVNREWQVYIVPGGNIYLVLTTTLGTEKTISFSGFAPIAGVWYHLIFWHDADNDQIGIVLNNHVAPGILANLDGVGMSNGPFELGAPVQGSVAIDGRIDEVGWWRRVLSTTERAMLYNNGDGLSYPFSSSGSGSESIIFPPLTGGFLSMSSNFQG